MPNDIRDDDPRGVWQHQATEAFVMTEEEIRQKAAEHRAKTRRKLLGTLAGPLAAALLYVFSVKEFPALPPLVLSLFWCSLGWSLIGLYLLNRQMWSAVLPADAGRSTGLEFCRREIGRRRDLLRRILLWSLGPVLLAIAGFFVALTTVANGSHGIFPNALPFLALVIVWIVGYFVVRLREQRQLQSELDELNEIERQNRR